MTGLLGAAPEPAGQLGAGQVGLALGPSEALRLAGPAPEAGLFGEVPDSTGLLGAGHAGHSLPQLSGEEEGRSGLSQLTGGAESGTERSLDQRP